ncbi:MAG TPA: EAL domain-containing protein [Pseudolabrys sp.]|nr:EAL domain-containing protein [Pseudolabrys sp.]
MHNPMSEDATLAAFGRRKVVPRVCVVDGKLHIRDFVRDALEEIGFIAQVSDAERGLSQTVVEQQSDLVVLGLSGGGIAANAQLEMLREIGFRGHVLVFGPPASPMVTAIHAIGRELGLTMLPLLPTPFSDRDLFDRVAGLLPKDTVASPAVDVGQALHGGWLELWYQSKVDTRSLSVVGAEALVRMRHPTWGVFLPERFLPVEDDPHFGALSDFVLARVTRDWRAFVTEHGNVELAINLPLTFFERGDAIDTLAHQLPRHPAFEGLIVEFEAAELVRNPALATRTARQLQLHNVAVAVDDLGEEWPLLMEFDDFPFAELKVDRAYIGGCADDRLKQATCRSIVELADRFGARTVAEGVETRADFVMARELEFDIVQGFFFAKPMEPHKFARRVLGKPVSLPE